MEGGSPSAMQGGPGPPAPAAAAAAPAAYALRHPGLPDARAEDVVSPALAEALRGRGGGLAEIRALARQEFEDVWSLPLLRPEVSCGAQEGAGARREGFSGWGLGESGRGPLLRKPPPPAVFEGPPPPSPLSASRRGWWACSSLRWGRLIRHVPRRLQTLEDCLSTSGGGDLHCRSAIGPCKPMASQRPRRRPGRRRASSGRAPGTLSLRRHRQRPAAPPSCSGGRSKGPTPHAASCSRRRTLSRPGRPARASAAPGCC
ncbi:unnamed protein product [Prorocentrum cordatum]|uniref:Uncharacterized protein n=1 Tax=Prorocentrum cordatum TaxID=2364126 RepID=A0ABN9R437_9DINO|nr:unnamed protein product [Polarella glacialis]